MPGKLLSCLEDFLDSNLSHLLLLLPVAWLPSQTQSFRFLACLLYHLSATRSNFRSRSYCSSLPSCTGLYSLEISFSRLSCIHNYSKVTKICMMFILPIFYLLLSEGRFSIPSQILHWKQKSSKDLVYCWREKLTLLLP